MMRFRFRLINPVEANRPPFDNLRAWILGVGVSLLPFIGFSQASLLQSGPMVGYSEMKEVMLWVQTKKKAKVCIDYWIADSLNTKQSTATVVTRPEDAYTAHLLADRVQPGHTYQYQVRINNKKVKLPYPARFQSQTLWQYRTDPPPFKMILGSCSYINETEVDRPGKPYGDGYEIFTAMAAQKADMMLWLGDNMYLREVDWGTRTGILHRFTHSRSVPEMQPLLAGLHNYAIWDDHDFGPDDSDRSFVHKDKTLEAFKLFWANPGYGVQGKPGITTNFMFNDVEFFLLDNRYHRTPNHLDNGEARTMLGKEQLEWLVDALVYSKASYKMIAIGGQVLTDFQRFENYINHSPEERAYLLKRIEEENITGVVFLSGDIHHTECSKMLLPNGKPVYEITSSPLTAGVAMSPENTNSYLLPGSKIGQRSFATISVSGPRTSRSLLLQVFDTKGTELWKYTIEPVK